MTRWGATTATTAAIVAIACAGLWPPAALRAQGSADLSGKWTLNASLSAGPTEIGFGADWVTEAAGPASGGSSGGGRGRRGGGGSGGGGSRGGTPQLFARPQSEDDAKRIRQLTDEVRDPSTHLVIADTMTAVTIIDDRGQPRTFHPDGRDEVIQLDGVPVSVASKRDVNGALVVVYHVQTGRDGGRQLRYTYTRIANPAQLTIDVQFIEHGREGDQVKRVYEPTKANEAPQQTQTGAATGSLAAAAHAAASGQPSQPGQSAGAPGAGSQPPGGPPASPGVPASSDTTPFNQQPDAELKGLTRLGLVVEGLTQQSALCGVKQEPLESAISKRLTEAGFKVMPNSDEDSYVYVNIMTASLSTGYCVSRYDASVLTHTTARLSYQTTPVLVEVQLLHKGGITGAAPTAHGEGVLKGVLEYIDQFTARIRAAGSNTGSSASRPQPQPQPQL